MFTSISRVPKNLSFLWFHDAGPPPCNIVAATHAWPFEWNTIKWKCWFPSCTSHISNAQQPMQVIARAERRFHHYRKLFWMHCSRPFSLKETLEESNVNTIHVPSDWFYCKINNGYHKLLLPMKRWCFLSTPIARIVQWAILLWSSQQPLEVGAVIFPIYKWGKQDSEWLCQLFRATPGSGRGRSWAHWLSQSRAPDDFTLALSLISHLTVLQPSLLDSS